MDQEVKPLGLRPWSAQIARNGNQASTLEVLKISPFEKPSVAPPDGEDSPEHRGMV